MLRYRWLYMPVFLCKKQGSHGWFLAAAVPGCTEECIRDNKEGG